VSIGAYCRRSVCAIGPEETARAAAERMDREGVGCLVVVEDGRPVGLLSDRDLALTILCDRLDAGAVSVGEIAAQPATTIAEDAPVAEAARRVRSSGLRRLPVVDADGRLVGILTADDLVGLAVGQLAHLAGAIEQQRPPEPQEA